MALRITAGKYKNKKLKSIPGKQLRPLSERVKEALFSIINEKIKGAVFLDLFAGTGNVGIEALSRGASESVFVEKDPERVRIIEENIKTLGVEEQTKVVCSDVFNYRTGIEPDIIFAGPPYKANISSEILNHLKNFDIAGCRTLIIIQHHYKEEANSDYFNKVDSRKYGKTVLDFFKKGT